MLTGSESRPYLRESALACEFVVGRRFCVVVIVRCLSSCCLATGAGGRMSTALFVCDRESAVVMVCDRAEQSSPKA